MPKPNASRSFAKSIRDWMELALVKAAIGLVAQLPRGGVLGLARLMGGAAFLLSRTQARVAMANLDLAFGDTLDRKRKQAIARASFQTFFRAIFDFAWFSQRSRRRLERWFRFDDSFETYRALSPVIVVTAHFGNWELLGQAGALHGNPPVSVAAMFPNPLLNAYITRLRERHGLGIASREGALRALLKALKEGGRVALIMDQNTRLQEGGVFVRFFGKPVTMSPAASVLAVRTNSPIVPAFCLALPDGSYRGYLGPVLRPDEAGGEAALNQCITDVFESEIRKHPEQWLWMYRRWKYVPPAEAGEGFPFYSHPAVESKGR